MVFVFFFRRGALVQHLSPREECSLCWEANQRATTPFGGELRASMGIGICLVRMNPKSQKLTTRSVERKYIHGSSFRISGQGLKLWWFGLVGFELRVLVEGTWGFPPKPKWWLKRANCSSIFFRAWLPHILGKAMLRVQSGLWFRNLVLAFFVRYGGCEMEWARNGGHQKLGSHVHPSSSELVPTQTIHSDLTSSRLFFLAV